MNNPFLSLPIDEEEDEKRNPFLSLPRIEQARPSEEVAESPAAASDEAFEQSRRQRGGSGSQRAAYTGADLLETMQAFGSGMAGDTSFSPPESLQNFDEAIRAGNPTPEQVQEVSDYYTNDPRARARLNADQRSELRRWLEAAETGNLEGLSPSSGLLRETPQGAFDAGQKIGDAWRAVGKPLEHLETAKDLGQNLMTRSHRLFERDRSLLPQLRETPEATPREPVDGERLRDEMLAQDPFFKRTERPLILDLLDRDDREDAHKSDLADKRTAGGWARTIGRGGAEGAGGAIGGAIQGKAIDLERVRMEMGFEPRPVEESPLYKTGENINELGRRIADIRDEYRDHWATDTIVGAGSMFTYGAVGLLSRGGMDAYSRMTGKTPSKATQAVAGYGPAVDMAQSSGVSQAYENVQEFREMYPELAAEMGIDDEWAVHFATGEDPRLWGAVQVASVVSMLRPLTGPMKSRTIKRMAETGFNEFTVENLGAWGQNRLRQSYDKDHPLWEQVPYQGATAGLGAALLALVFSPFTRRAPDGPTGGTRAPDTGNRFAPGEELGAWGDRTVAQQNSPLQQILQGLGDNGIDASVLYGNEADEAGKPLDLNDIDGVIGWIGNNFNQTPDSTLSTDQATVTGGLLSSPQPFAEQTGLGEITREANQELSTQQNEEGGLESRISYEDFVGQYEGLVNRLMSYKPETIGHKEISAKLADLVDQYPDYEAQYDQGAADSEDSAPAKPASRLLVESLQNRDRSRKNYLVQMDQIATNPDYNRLSVSRDSNTGAPMVFSASSPVDKLVSPAQIGRSDNVSMSDGRGGVVSIPVRYAVVEADKVRASHSAGGKRDDLYGFAGLTALNNGRTAGLQEAWKRGTTGAYIQALKADSESHGIAPEAIDALSTPVLIRLFDAESMAGIENPGAASNVSLAETLSASEQATTDARALSPETVSSYQPFPIDSAANRDFIRMAARDLGSKGDLFMADGTLSAQGRKRVESALLARAFPDPAIITELTESLDPDIKSLGGTLLDVSGEWSQLRDAVSAGGVSAEFDITDNVIEAVNLVRKARQTGTPIREILGQGDIFSGGVNPLTEAIVRIMYRGDTLSRQRARDKISAMLLGYVRNAMKNVAGMGDIFGDRATPAQTLEAQRAEAEGEESGSQQGSLLAGRPDDVGGQGQQRPGADESGTQAEGDVDETAVEGETGPYKLADSLTLTEKNTLAKFRDSAAGRLIAQIDGYVRILEANVRRDGRQLDEFDDTGQDSEGQWNQSAVHLRQGEQITKEVIQEMRREKTGDLAFPPKDEATGEWGYDDTAVSQALQWIDNYYEQGFGTDTVDPSVGNYDADAEIEQMPESEIFPDQGKPFAFDLKKHQKFIPEEEAKERVDSWKKTAKEIGKTGENKNKLIISLFDYTGKWSQPWVDAGYQVIRHDIKSGSDVLVDAWIYEQIEDHRKSGIEVYGVLSACPCTTFAASGARWWEDLHNAESPEAVVKVFGEHALLTGAKSPLEYNQMLVEATRDIVRLANPSAFHALENPMGRIDQVTSLPQASIRFQPHNFGDPYTKRTQIFGAFNRELPVADVYPSKGSAMHDIRGDSPTGAEERSVTPEGFAYAFFMANDPVAREALAAQKPDEAESTDEQQPLIPGEWWKADTSKMQDGWANTLVKARQAASQMGFESTGLSHEQLVDRVVASILASDLLMGQKITGMQLRKRYGELTGQKVEAGTIEVKRAEEAMEAAGIVAARNMVMALASPSKEGGKTTNAEIYEKLLVMHGNMPKLGTRTSGSVARQAYSTPLPLAWVAQVLGGIHPRQVIVEPTAGNGSLIFAAVANASSFANELDGNRAKMLGSIIDVNVSQEDATAWMPKEKVMPDLEKKADLVIANPPFGTVKQDGESKVFNIDGYETTEIDHAIVFQSLKSMKDDGRAVFIIGSTMAQSEKGRTQGYRSANKIRFFKTLMDRYNVVDLFTVDGSLYAQQGASFPVDVIVIEGRGKSALKIPGHTLPRVYNSYEQLGELIDGNLLEPRSKQDGSRGDQAPAPAETDGQPVLGASGAPGGGDAGAGAGSQAGSGEAGAGTGPAGISAGTDAQSGDSTVRPDRDESVPIDAVRPEGHRPGGQAGQESAGGEADVRGNQSGGVAGGAVDAAIDTALDEVFGAKTSADAAIDTALDDVFGQETKPKSSGQKPGAKLSGTRTAGEAAKSAAKNTQAAFTEAGEALTKLFSPGKGTLGMGPVFNEQTYAQAKPHFVAMARHLGDAATDIVDVAKAIVTALRDQFGMNREAVENMRPYIGKFLEDLREGVIDLAGESAEETKPKKAPRKKEEGTDRQVDYEPGSSAQNVGTLVPVNLKDAIHAAVAAVKETVGDLDQYVANELGVPVEKISDFFSAEQIDALALTFDNFSRGMGFILGDQTGVGKGRVVAGVLLYAMRRGLKPIFVTEKPNLYADMFRDMTDIGMDQVRILMTNSQNKIPLNEEQTAWLKTPDNKEHEADLRRMMQKGSIGDYDVIFTTYNQMQPVKKGQETFRNEFLRQFGTDNVVVFDEAHNAGGAGQASVEADGANRAKFAREMVSIARNILYSSATWAKRPDVMDLYSRTSMSLAVDDPGELISAIAAGGVPLQQVVSSMLARDGQMIRRERSFKGVEYNTTSVEVDVQLAEQVAKVLNNVFVFDKAKRAAVDVLAGEAAQEGEQVRPGGEVQKIAESINFASVMHNLIDQMLLSLKMDATLAQVREAIEAGRKPVVTLSNTMGSFVEEYAKDFNLKPGDSIDISFNDLLMRYLDKSREAKRKTVIKRGRGEDSTGWEDLRDSDWERWTLTDDELGPKGVALYEETKAMIESIDMSGMPVSPIDFLRAKIAEMGYKTTEITGRHEVIDYTGGATVYRKRPEKEVGPSGRLQSITQFNNGEIDVIILNQAGSTGLSLHASEKFVDQRQRVMIIAQPEKNVDTHMQMLGRVHRTGQVIVPEYRQLIANIPAEKRPAAVLAKKMASLNANTTASRGSDVTAEDVPDIMNHIGDEVAFSLMEQNPDLHAALGDPLNLGGSTDGAARKVTGRLPMLPVAQQAQFYEELESEYADTLERLEAMGESPLEAKTFDLDAKTVKSEVVREASGDTDSPFAGEVVAEKVDMKRIGKPMTGAEVQSTLDQYLKDILAGFPDEMDLSGAPRPFQSLGRTEAAGRVYTNQIQNDADAGFAVYKTEVLDAIDTSDKKGEERRKRMVDALRENESRFARIMGSAPVGSSLILQTEQGPYRAVVGRIEQRGTPKNPLALGSWKMTLHIADAMRTITVPLSQLDTFDGQKMKLSPQRVSLEQTMEQFDRAQSISREERWIMTGNLLAAYGMFPTGAILNFTDEKGEMRQGILMPKKWDLDKALDAKPFQFANPEHVVAFLNEQENGIVQTKDESFSIRNVRSRWDRQYRIAVPKAKRTGGKWFLNEEISNALQGREFVTKGKVMTVTVDAETARAIMQIVARSEPLITYSYKDVAKGASGVQEEGGLYSGYGKPGKVQASRKRAALPGQFDLFSEEVRPADPVQAKKQDRDNFFALHHRVPTKTIKVGVERVTNQEEAAHVLSGIRKHSEEVFYALITDADGAILDVQLHSKGTHNQSLVEPSIVTAAAASLQGSAYVWFAHNHPSGNQQPSPADIKITKILDKALDGTPLRVKGHLIFGSEGVSVLDQDGDILDTAKKITPRLRKRTIPVTERMIKKRLGTGWPDSFYIASTAEAESFANGLESENALILLNNQNQPVAILSMTKDEMQNVRRQAWSVHDNRGSSLRILNAINKSGGVSAFIKSKDRAAGHNLGRYIEQTRVGRVLDLIVEDKATGIYTSIGGQVSFNDPIPFMSQTKPLHLRRQISGIAKSLGSNLRVHEDVISAREETGVKIPSDARGFFYQGKVHVIADAHDNTFEVESTIWHEVFHAGIWNLFKGDLGAYRAAMHGIRDANANIQKAAAKWVKSFGKDFREDLTERGFSPEQVEVFTELRSIEEALADLSGAAGATVPLKGVREFVRKVIRWMRSQGWRSLPNFLEGLSDAEAFAIITEAREAVMEPGDSGAPAFDRSGRPSTLGLTPERVDKILREEAVSHRPDTGRAYVAWIDPGRFVPATTPSAYISEVTDKVGELDLSRLSEETQTPFLYIEKAESSEEDGNFRFRITGHEGRHRMQAAANAGIRKMPVILIRRDSSWTNELEQMEGAYLFGQRHGSLGRAQSGTFAEIIVPLIYNNRDQILAEFSDRADIRFSRKNPNSAVSRQQRGLASWVKNGQPIDRTMRFMFDPFGKLYDSAGRFRPGKFATNQISKTLKERQFPEKMSWLNGPLETARAGLIDRHGLDQEFVNREFMSQAEKSTIIGIGESFLKKMAKANIGAEEAKALQGILAEGDVADADMSALSEPIRQAIDDLGLQMVELGILERDTYHRHLGKYLHRSYFKYETAMHGLPKWVKWIGNRRRKAIYGQELRARGLKQELTTMRLLRDMPKDWWGRKLSPEEADKQLVNTEWLMLDLVKTPGEGSGTLEGMEAGGKPKTARRVFWPADMPVPARLSEYTQRGSWKVTGTKGRQLILRRDFTRQEREQMGEILDARYNIVRTFSILAGDIANGRFFKDIAENPEWALREAPEESRRLGRVGDASEANLSRLKTYSELDWVKVPSTLVTGTKQPKWGAIAGMYVRPAIWRDLNEMDKMSHQGSWAALLRQWKINKTARSPVVHMNNVMSNLILMDLIDVRMQDLVRGVVEYVKKGPDWEDARDHGAFGVGFAEKELNRNYLEPLLQDIIKEAQNSRDDVTGRAHVLSKILYGIYTTVKKADQKMVDLYGIEDEVFRMATYMRYRSQGASQMEAAQIARDQFLNYDIRAPWVNAARQTILPFISYTYRAVPAVATAIAHRPHKLAKYILLSYLWNLMAYEIEPGDEDEERRTMRDAVQGTTWASIPFTDIGLHRMVRMPARDKHGNPYFQDVYRWIPAGDIFDTNQGQFPLLPAPLQAGGPIMLGSELALNRAAFTGKDIVDWDTDTTGQATGKLFDHLWKSWMPSAAYIPGSWHYDKLSSAIRGERDMLGRPYSVPAALATGVGIKIQPHDVQLGYYFRGNEIQRNIQAAQSEMRQIQMDAGRNIGSAEGRAKRIETVREKLRLLEQQAKDLQGR